MPENDADPNFAPPRDWPDNSAHIDTPNAPAPHPLGLSLVELRRIEAGLASSIPSDPSFLAAAARFLRAMAADLIRNHPDNSANAELTPEDRRRTELADLTARHTQERLDEHKQDETPQWDPPEEQVPAWPRPSAGPQYDPRTPAWPMAGTVLLCFAFVFACIAAFVMQGYGRWHFGWLSLVFFYASLLFGSAQHLMRFWATAMLVHRFAGSTAVTRASYNPETQQMDVQFVGGGTYTHEGVPPSVYEAFVAADSPGRYYHQNIKGAY